MEAVVGGETVNAERRTLLSSYSIVIVVTHHRLASAVRRVELPEVRGVASKAFSVNVAGHAVVGTGLTGGAGLTV